MILNYKTSKGYKYYCIITSKRIENVPREQMILYLGRLDNIQSSVATQKLEQVRALGVHELTYKVQAVLAKHGHIFAPSLMSVDLKTVRSYGPDLALVRIAQEIDLISIIDRNSPKGGGPSLGKMTTALAIYANLRPGSLLRFVKWYKRSPLPLFLELPPKAVTYDAALNALDYLQPEMTRIFEAETYAMIQRTFKYKCNRIDIDSTTVELEGGLCRILAKFGRSKKGGTSKRRQIMITYFVDQKSMLLGHEVFPGNKNDGKTLKQLNTRLNEEYDDNVHDAPRVVDRGYTSLANIMKMDKNGERFIVAMRVTAKGSGCLDIIGTDNANWLEVDKGVRANSLISGKIKWVVIWNDYAAEQVTNGRKAKILKAKKALDGVAKSVENGKVKSRAERDGRIGAILRRFGVTKFLQIQGARKGFGFTVYETGKSEEKTCYDGYQVFATSELNMTEKEVFESYRARDRIEKAIRTLKHCLGLGPIYVSKKEHVLGHVYIHALAYQLRALMRLKLNEVGLEMSPEEALWELEQLQVAELAVHGEYIGVVRKMTTFDGVAKTLVQVFGLTGKKGLPGVEGGI